MSDETEPKAAAPEATEVALEGAPPRETVVTFTTQHLSYYAGESAAFTEEEAARLAELGVIEGAAPTAPPVNVDVPHVSQAADVLTCTMGNWQGVPSSYAYQWQLDGADIGTDASTVTVTAADVGHTATCVVTATNDLGSTTAPPSNAVVVADIAP
jgi:hypothetical protein